MRRAKHNADVALDDIDIRRDVVDRLNQLEIAYYVTGSEAMAMHGIAYRQTNDTDFMLAIGPADYEARLRPAFEPEYLVNDLEAHPPRWLGSAIHTRSIGKADFIVRESGSWANEAFARRMLLEDPLLGPIWVATLEDLLLAKLEWSDGRLDGLQGRDARAIAGGPVALDIAYVRRQAASLGIGPLVEKVLGDA